MNRNEIFHSTVFCEKAQAQGVLYILKFMSNDYVNFSKAHYYSVAKERAENGIITANLSYGTYFVLSYDIESNGRIQNGLPADSTNIYILGDFIGIL